MSVYGGDVGLDEFAKHPNARLLWETAQARVTWNYDIAIWSSHDGEDTPFNQFAIEARAACTTALSRQANPLSPSEGERDGERGLLFPFASERTPTCNLQPATCNPFEQPLRLFAWRRRKVWDRHGGRNNLSSP